MRGSFFKRRGDYENDVYVFTVILEGKTTFEESFRAADEHEFLNRIFELKDKYSHLVGGRTDGAVVSVRPGFRPEKNKKVDNV